MTISYEQEWPKKKLPIVIIGAGGIVKDAHLPAYKKAGFKVLAIYDLHVNQTKQLASTFDIENVCETLPELIAIAQGTKQVVYDLAVPAAQIIKILPNLPDGSAVLIQKPMGETLEAAQEILEICKAKQLKASVNFQLRFAPFVNAARSIIQSGAIGELYDLKVKVCTYTPWHLWDFLLQTPRVEILYHSIHYIDLVRSFLGEPKRVMAKTVKHPNAKVASTRSNMLFDYGNEISATINTNHDHNFGREHQKSFIKWEGTKGVIVATMGLLLDYPHGEPDAFEYCVINEDGQAKWQTVAIEGSWFPDAFMGSMASLMRYVEDSENQLPTAVTDALKTMELVEAAYKSSTF